MALSKSGEDYSESHATNYLSINRKAYDKLAEDYRARRESDREKDLQLIQPFIRLIRQQFGNSVIRVLDLGCGNGLNLSMFADEGFEVAGIDISAGMLKVARETCPSAELIRKDFLAHSFAPNSFHGVFAKAIIHLFPKKDALKVLAKINLILKPEGIFYVTTTVEKNHREGLQEKTDYGGGVRRYRRNWTQGELTKAVIQTGFQITEKSYNQEKDRAKTWFNIWATKII